MVMAISVLYPAGSRGTKIELDTLPADIISTIWQLSSVAGGTFSIRTTLGGTDSGNVLDSNLDYLTIWLPPAEEFGIRTRHGLTNERTTEWTTKVFFDSRGHLNSHEKYLALSGISGVDNV